MLVTSKMMITRVLLAVFTFVSLLMAEEDKYALAKPKAGWLELETLSMLPLERESMANHLSAYVANNLTASNRIDRTKWAQRLLGLALSLHPENPRARQTNAAIASGTPLPALETELDDEVLAQLLYHRSTGLAKGKNSDSTLAPFLLAAAAYIGPNLEDAVYEFECRHLRDGALNWNPISGHPKKNKSSR